MSTIYTSIWREEAEPDNPFATRIAYCRGYDVYGQMLGNARWVEMIFLLFQPDAPTALQADMLEALAVALANPGPRDASVHAAMCGGVGGSTAAASLMAALAVGAGQLSGGREVFLAMEGWERCGTDLVTWNKHLAHMHNIPGSIWPDSEHAAGFDPNGVATPTHISQTLDCLAGLSTGTCLTWLKSNLPELETAAGHPLALSGVAAAAFCDLGFTPEQGEMLYLLLRLPGAAAHALEQRHKGYKSFPFGIVELETGLQKAPS